jgi:hypothetical protein
MIQSSRGTIPPQFQVRSGRPARILSISSVYPTPTSNAGSFVRARLQAVAKYADLKVLAPLPLLHVATATRFGDRRTRIPAGRPGTSPSPSVVLSTWGNLCQHRGVRHAAAALTEAIAA